MKISELSEHTLMVLKKSGWYIGRQYDTTLWVKQLEDEGYAINEYALLVLQELGGIYIRERAEGKYVGATLDFNPFDSASGEYDRLDEFEKASNDKLFPIGSLQDYIVYAGFTQKIYLGDWAGLYLIGNSVEEYLENVFKRGYEPISIRLNR